MSTKTVTNADGSRTEIRDSGSSRTVNQDGSLRNTVTPESSSFLGGVPYLQDFCKDDIMVTRDHDGNTIAVTKK